MNRFFLCLVASLFATGCSGLFPQVTSTSTSTDSDRGALAGHEFPSAYAGDNLVTITNHTDRAMCSIHFSPTTEDTWGGDWLLDDEQIDPGESREFRLDSLTFDIQVMACRTELRREHGTSGQCAEEVVFFAEGHELARHQIAISGTVQIDVSDEGATPTGAQVAVTANPLPERVSNRIASRSRLASDAEVVARAVHAGQLVYASSEDIEFAGRGECARVTNGDLQNWCEVDCTNITNSELQDYCYAECQ